MNQQDQLEACARCVEALLQVVRDTHLPVRAWLLELQQALLALHSAALRLDWPNVDAPHAELPEDPRRQDSFREAYGLVESRLGQSRFYWTQFEADGPDLEPTAPPAVLGDLADDIADILRDVASPLEAWRADPTLYSTACAWEWRATPFESHWGRHLVSASVAIHHLVFDRGVG